MTKRSSNKLISFKDHLSLLTKNDLTKILDTFHIEYKKSLKKDSLINILLDNINNIVNFTLDLFQVDEFHNIKLLIKKKGKITIRVNHLLLDFMNNLQRHHLVVSYDNKTFYLPKEILESYKIKSKNKKTIVKVKENTKEYGLILGFIDAYGVIEYQRFYDEYAKLYKLSKEKALERIKILSEFYGEFRVYQDKKKTYIASNAIQTLKECKEFTKKDIDYAVYTAEELMSIHDFSFMTGCKSYKKLIKFINRNYYVEKGSFKIVNKYVFIPYLTNYQLNKEKALELLSGLIDDYFEFNNKKHKNKFMSLVENLALDYPSWNLKGHSEREKI